MTLVYLLSLIGIAVLTGLGILVFIRNNTRLSSVEKDLKEKNYKKAADQVLRYLKHQRANYLAYKYLGEAYEGLDHYRHAIDSYEKALVELERDKSQASRTEILLKLGDLYRSAEENNEALGYYKMVLSDSPRNPPALWNIAEILFKSRKYDACKEYLERFVSVRLENTKAPLLLSWVFYYIGEYQKSVEQIGIITQSSKYYSIEQLNEFTQLLAYNYFELKKYEEVIRVLNPLLADEIVSGEVLLKLVTSLVLTGENQKAIEAVDSSLPRIQQNDKCKLLFDIAGVFMGSNDIIHALGLWQTAFGINPKFPGLKSILERYDLLIRNRHLDSYYSGSDDRFSAYVLKKMNLIADKVIVEITRENMIIRTNTACSVFFRQPGPLGPVFLSDLENRIRGLGFYNQAIDIYSLFGIEEGAKAGLFYKKIKEISGRDFLNLFTPEPDSPGMLPIQTSM